MIDTTNDYHKIGISNHPYYREKALQSEKPIIDHLSRKKSLKLLKIKGIDVKDVVRRGTKFESARITITGIEIVYMIKKDQLNRCYRTAKSAHSL